MTVKELIEQLEFFEGDQYVQIYAEPNEDPQDFYYAVDEIVSDTDDCGPVCLIMTRG